MSLLSNLWMDYEIRTDIQTDESEFVGPNSGLRRGTEIQLPSTYRNGETMYLRLYPYSQDDDKRPLPSSNFWGKMAKFGTFLVLKSLILIIFCYFYPKIWKYLIKICFFIVSKSITTHYQQLPTESLWSDLKNSPNEIPIRILWESGPNKKKTVKMVNFWLKNV